MFSCTAATVGMVTMARANLICRRLPNRAKFEIPVNHTESAYGLWSLVIINSAIFIMFAFSFFKPATARDWRTF